MSGPVVLIGFAEALAAPEALFSLRDAGFTPRFFHRDGAVPLAVRRLAPKGAVALPAPERDAAAAVATLRGAVDADAAIAAVMALDDAALWLVDRAFGMQLDGTGPRLASATGPRAALALDKIAQLSLASRAGLTPPPTEILDGPEDRGRISAFPCIVKSARAGQVVDGCLRRGGAVYLEDASLRDRADALAGVLFPALAQPLIRGTGEGLFGFATATGPVAWSAHRRIRMMNPHGSGASACESIPVDPDLREAATRLIAEADWRGPFMIELLRDETGAVWFMELNGRLWGSTALARRAGLDYPAWAVRQALDPGFMPPEAPPYRRVSVRHLGRDLLHVAHVLRGPRTPFYRAGWPSFGGALTAALKPGPGRGFYNHDARHPWYFLEEAAVSVAGQLRWRQS